MTLTLQDLRVQTQHNLLMTGAANPTRPASLADLVEVLKADPDTLIITKVDGEWQLPGEAWRVLNTAAALGHPGGSIPLANDLLDALLEGQPK